MPSPLPKDRRGRCQPSREQSAFRLLRRERSDERCGEVESAEGFEPHAGMPANPNRMSARPPETAAVVSVS
jgi:hypothetical protein